MPSTEPHIVCAVASDDLVESVVNTARRFADGGYRVHFLHSADVPGRTTPVYGGAGVGAPAYSRSAMVHEFSSAGHELLERLALDEDTAEVVLGDPVEELTAKAEQVQAEFIILGGRGHGPLAGAIVGSVTRTLAKDGRWPLLLVGTPADGAPRGPVVCGVAAPLDDAVQVAQTAERLARRMRKPLVLAHVDEESAVPSVDAGGFPSAPGAVLPASSDRSTDQSRASRLLDEVAGRLEGGVEIRTEVLAGPPASALASLATDEGAEALVVGRRGLGAVRSAIAGSVSLDLIRNADRPVMVVPASARVSRA